MNMVITTGKDFGLVYTGSKSRLLHYIDYIIERHPNKKYFIDLFTGGFAVSDYILTTRKSVKVIANDINKGLMDLYKKCFVEENGIEEIKEVAFKFIGKDKFKEIADDESDYPSWYKVLISLVWGFGSSIGKATYGFNEFREELLYTIHTFLKTNDIKPFQDFVNKNRKLQDKEPITINISKRIKDIDFTKQPFIKQNLFYTPMKNIIVNDLGVDEDNFRMSYFTRICALFKIAQKKYKALYDEFDIKDKEERLYLYNYSYDELISKLPKEILDNAVIYCDIPYNTKTGTYIYSEQGFNYEKFWNWFKQVDVPCYVSEYSHSDYLQEGEYQLLKQDEIIVNFATSDKRTYKAEKLFYNKHKDYEPTLEDMLFNN